MNKPVPITRHRMHRIITAVELQTSPARVRSSAHSTRAHDQGSSSRSHRSRDSRSSSVKNASGRNSDDDQAESAEQPAAAHEEADNGDVEVVQDDEAEPVEVIRVKRTRSGADAAQVGTVTEQLNPYDHG